MIRPQKRDKRTIEHDEPFRVLLATDGSALSHLATEVLAASAPDFASIRVISVHPPATVLIAGPWSAAIGEIDRVEAALERQARVLAEQAGRQLHRGSRLVEAVARRGRAADTIAAEADQWAADVVVAGARGHGTLECVFLGSVTSDLVGRLRVPLLIARTGGLEKVVVAHDGSETSSAALAFAAASPLLARSRFRVVSIAPTAHPWWAGLSPVATTDGPNMIEALEANKRLARESADSGIERLHAAGHEADEQVVQGQPAEGIIDAAEAWGANVIVIGSHGRSEVMGLLPGSVARTVVSSASCSVLVVPRAQEPDEGSDRDAR